jgi:glycosyltransferase involved in cell wall biosynthesis
MSMAGQSSHLETPPSKDVAILYVGARLPELSETFVYRELLNLRQRGHRVEVASTHRPRAFPDDVQLTSLSREAVVVYDVATWLALLLALPAHPRLFAGAVRDAVKADHRHLSDRLKHVLQAAMGIGTAWRLRRQGIGHVHAHMANAPAMVALYIARTLGARFSFTGHAADLFVQRSALAFKLRQADFVSCISRWHRDFYQEIADLPDDRLPVVRCSVAMPATVAGASRREIVTVARLVAKKGIDLLLRAFAASNAVDWHLRILGDGPERRVLEALSRELGLVDRVTFEGAQPHSVCLKAISDAGLFVLPCRTALTGDKDGIPVVLMEAMAAGRCVVAGRLPAIEELIDDGVSGVLVPGNDATALGLAIDALTGDIPRRERLGQAARSKVAAEFSDEINLERLEQAIHASAGYVALSGQNESAFPLAHAR